MCDFIDLMRYGGGQFMEGSVGINIDWCTDIYFYWWVRYS